jgi:hypothetical protein
MLLSLEIVAFIFGLLVVVCTLLSAIRTVVLPRGVRVVLTQIVFQGLGLVFFPLARRTRRFKVRDRWLAFYAPLSILLLPVVWLCLVLTGFAFMFWGLGNPSWGDAFVLSGSSLLTLGFDKPQGVAPTILSFGEAILGIGVLSLMITYLPTLYSAFARRETLVTRLARRIGSPPSVLALYENFKDVRGCDKLDALWEEWEGWFAELEESHSSFPFLVYFRSPSPNRNWLTAAGTILDSVALATSTLTAYNTANAHLTLHTGYMSLRAIAVVLDLPVNSHPQPDTPISISRSEFDQLYQELTKLNYELVADREKAWKDFAAARSGYDQTLLALAEKIFAPYAPWSSDRSPNP